MVARFGGDEFGILLEDIDSERDAIESVERIAAIFARADRHGPARTRTWARRIMSPLLYRLSYRAAGDATNRARR